MSLIHMRCASVQLDTNARLSFLMPFFWEFFLVRWRCLFRFSVDGFIDFRLVCNVTSYIYGLHFYFVLLMTITKMPCDQYMWCKLCGWPIPNNYEINLVLGTPLMITSSI